MVQAPGPWPLARRAALGWPLPNGREGQSKNAHSPVGRPYARLQGLGPQVRAVAPFGGAELASQGICNATYARKTLKYVPGHLQQALLECPFLRAKN